jgi:hypothetical protein
VSAAEASSRLLDDEDRALGYQTLRLLDGWRLWTRRRVESISYETATSIKRRISVDLRMSPDLFGTPVVLWGEVPTHYVPLARLRKRRLLGFDLRDETDRALPLITKRKNAAIAAGMIVAAAQVMVALRLSQAGSGVAVSPNTIEVPEWLEEDALQLALRNPGEAGEEPGAEDLLGSYRLAAGRTEPIPIREWGWQLTNTGLSTQMSERPPWQAFLGSEGAFVDLAFDVSRLFLVLAPLTYEPGVRRIVKFCYSEYLGDDESTAGRGVKAWAVRHGLARGWNVAEDWLEGLPPADSGAGEEWSPPLGSAQAPATSLRRRTFQALGWTTRIVKLETPAVTSAGSYHLDLSTPEGIQIRRAQLVTVDARGEKRLHAAQRGNRTMRAVDLYTSGADCRSGNAYLNIRAESSLVIRGAAICAGIVAALLTVLWWFGSKVTAGSAPHAEAVALALVIIPGLLTALTVRDAEHPLATSMVFGLRVLATVPGLLAFMAAIEVLFGSAHSPFGIVLFGLAWSIAALLLGAWRLAARGRPDRDALG